MLRASTVVAALAMLGRAAWASEEACAADADDASMLQVKAGQLPAKKVHWPHKHKKQGLLVIDMQNDFINGSLTVQGGDSIVPTINQLSALPWTALVFTMDYHADNHISFADNSPSGKKPFENVRLSYNAQQQVCGEEYVPSFGASADATCTEGGDGVDTFDQTLWPKHCIQGTTGQLLDERLVVPEDAAIVKKGITEVADSYGAFANNVEYLGNTTAHGKDAKAKHSSENDFETWLHKLDVEELFVVGLALDYCVKFTSLQALDRGFKVSLVTDAVKAVDPEGTGKMALEELRQAGVNFITSAELVKAVELNREKK